MSLSTGLGLWQEQHTSGAETVSEEDVAAMEATRCPTRLLAGRRARAAAGCLPTC